VNDAREAVVIRTLETSVLLSWIERMAQSVRLAADRSRSFGAAKRVWSNTSANAGLTLVVAVAVHLLLMMIVRPAHAYWLIVPACAAVAAVVLMARARQRPPSRD
jgi:sugar phosphate permease